MKTLMLFFFLAVTFTTCKKDYPDDIPQWIKDKIKQEKRNDCYFWVDEYLKGDSIVYKIAGAPCQAGSSDWDLYDYNGNYICGYFGIAGTNCPFNTTSHLIFRRQIWHDDSKKCR